MIRFAITCIAALVVGASSAVAAGRLELSLRPSQPDFVLAEPVTVIARLANAGDGPIQAPRYLEPEYASVTYTIAGPIQGAFVPWAIKEPEQPFVTLQPGQVIEQEVELFYGGNGWTFRQPGQYEIRATALGSITSAPMTLSIRAPGSDAERSAAERMINSDEAGRFLLFRGGEHLAEGRSILESVVATAPETPHAAFANVALGINDLRQARNFATGTVRQANPEAALQRLNMVQVRDLPVSWVVESNVGLAKALRDTGQPARAMEIEGRLPDLVQQQFQGINPAILREQIIPDVRRNLQLEAN